MVEICILKLDPEDAIFVVEYLDYAKFLTVGKFRRVQMGLDLKSRNGYGDCERLMFEHSFHSSLIFSLLDGLAFVEQLFTSCNSNHHFGKTSII